MKSGWVSKQAGFTIVELLIVVVVIAILAAVSIVAYQGIQNRANDSAVQADLKSIANQLGMYKADKGKHPSTIAELTEVGVKIARTAYAVSPMSNFNLPYCIRSGGADFVVIAKSKSGKVFSSSNTDGVREITGSVTWDSATVDGGGICTGLGYSGALSHGYYSPDLSSGPWRSWTNS